MSLVSWTAPKTADEVDRRAVVNPEQARALLAEVGRTVPELEAFFGCMYYAALRRRKSCTCETTSTSDLRRLGHGVSCT
jgi:hypothetical protein